MTPLAKGYRRFVEPDHPILQELFGAAGAADAGLLEQTLEILRSKFVYSGFRGMLGFDELHAGYRRRNGQGIQLNCVTLCCLLVSRLREAGFTANEAYVALGQRRTSEPGAATDFHAWALVRLGEKTLWIDPNLLRPTPCEGREIMRDHRLHVLFNDTHAHVLEPAKRRILLGEERSCGLTICAYGRLDEKIRELLPNRDLRELLGALFAAPEGLPAAGREDAAGAALECDLLCLRDGRLHPGPALVLIPRRAERQLMAAIEPALDRYLGIAGVTIPKLRRAYEECDAARHFEWSEVCHSLVAGMFMDFAVDRRMHAAGKTLGPEADFRLWVFEDLSGANFFGLRWHGQPAGGCGLGELWHLRLPRSPLKITGRLVVEMARIAGDEPVAVQDGVALRYLKLARRWGTGHRLKVPAFRGPDCGLLGAELLAGADRLIAEVYLPIREMAAGLDWWRRGDKSLRHAISRLILNGATDRVIDAGLLPELPTSVDVPFAWGRWLWAEGAQEIGLLPDELALSGEGEAG